MAIPTWVDTASFAAGDQDITAYGRDASWSTQRGTSSLPGPGGFVASAGTYTSTLDNRDRRFDPNYASGAYYPDVVPGVPLAKVATWAATPYSVFTGRVDDWPQLYPAVAKDQVVNLQATDAVGFFSGIQFADARPAELSGARIQAIVDASGWPGPTAISTGQTIVNALPFGVVSAWSHMSDVCNAELGDLYVAKDGTLTFRDRDLIISETRSSVSQATFGDTSNFKYADVTMGTTAIVNDCTITYTDKGAQVNAQDAGSIASPWGLHSLNLTLPIHTGTMAQAYANWIVALYKTPLTTFTSLTVKPGRDTTNLFPQVLGRELSDLITVIRTPGVDTGSGALVPSTALNRACWIRGIKHDYSNHVWTGTTFSLQDASWRSNLFTWDVSLWDGANIWWF